MPPPRRALTWHSVGRQRLGRGWGGWGGQVGRTVWVSANRREEVPLSPSTGSPVSRVCRVPPVPSLLPTSAPPSQPSGNPGKKLEPARYPKQLQAKPGNSSATFPKSPRAPRPCAPGACPPSSCTEGLRSLESPATCSSFSTPPGPRATSFPKMAAISSGGVP